jgi:H+/Cl- antiporter ClcA
LLLILAAGLFFGLCSLYFIEILELFKRLAERIKIWEPLKGLIGGAAIVCLVYLFSTSYLGLGIETIESTLKGNNIVWHAFLIKGLFVAITINFGGSGGVITPILFIGATAGAAFASLFNQDIAIFAAIGSVSLLAGATNTPIASSIMAIELFGSEIAPYAAMSCVISFLMTGHRCVYPSQILGIRKSMSINVDIGMDMKKIKTSIKSHDRSVLGVLFKYFAKFKENGSDIDEGES